MHVVGAQYLTGGVPRKSMRFLLLLERLVNNLGAANPGI
jgi:hypothetical protein